MDSAQLHAGLDLLAAALPADHFQVPAGPQCPLPREVRRPWHLPVIWGTELLLERGACTLIKMIHPRVRRVARQGARAACNDLHR